MKSNLMIIGAGGHGRVIADIAALCGYENIAFLDDAENGTVPVAGVVKDFYRYLSTHRFVVGIGSNPVRERITTMLAEHGAQMATLIHPAAVVGSQVQIGEGTVVMAGAVINTGARIGKGVIINTACSVDHDCTVEDFVHISVGAHLAGTVAVGTRTMIGAGATVIQNICLGGDCMVGAGAVVVHDLLQAGTYIGVPAKSVSRG